MKTSSAGRGGASIVGAWFVVVAACGPDPTGSSADAVTTTDVTNSPDGDAATGDIVTSPDATSADTTTTADAPDVPFVPPDPSCDPPLALADTSAPDHVVTDCTRAALQAALDQGGTITFDCPGDGPTTIAIDETLVVPTDRDVTLDGAHAVTLDGLDAHRILDLSHGDYRKNTHTLTLQRLAFVRGRVAGTHAYEDAPAPCSSGFYDGFGGAIHVRDATLHVIDCSFVGNHAERLGPDVGGGAISLNGALGAVVVGSTFRDNHASNGGAIQCLQSDLDIYDSVFEDNSADGFGANSDSAEDCPVVAETNQHQVGSGGNGGAVVIDGSDDDSHTFCGVIFRGNQAGEDALGGGIFRTPNAGRRSTFIDRCLFDGNRGDSAAGAYFHDADLHVKATTFANNVSQGGCAGIQADGTNMSLSNVTFSNNTALAGLGGGICLFGGTGTLAFCTFADNHADGGDPYFGAALAGNPSLTITSSIFANNTAQNPGAPMQCMSDGAGSGNLQWPRGHLVGGGDDAECTPGITFADPKLAPLGDNGGPTPTRRPAADSPAAGLGVDCTTEASGGLDQRGWARPDSGCTAGAVEVVTP